MCEYDRLSLNDIQAVLLEDYKIFYYTCKKHGLKVFAIGGTALGAIREKGFIPWDDDMDMGLSRKEFEYIKVHKAEFDKDMPEYLNISQKERGHHIVVADARYKVKRVDELNGGYINIDVHPIDGAPNGTFRRLFHSVKTFFYRACYKMCAPELIGVGKWRPRWQTILIKLLKECQFLFKNPKKMSKKWDDCMKKYDYDKQKYVAIYVGKYIFKDIYPKSWFEPGIEIPFEDTTIIVPSGYDKYLHQLYGDYMTPLPEPERNCHIS